VYSKQATHCRNEILRLVNQSDSELVTVDKDLLVRYIKAEEQVTKDAETLLEIQDEQFRRKKCQPKIQ